MLLCPSETPLTKRRIIIVFLWLALAGGVRAANPALPVIPATVFNITNYDAVGDGIKDNTTNLQNTINAANAAGGGIVEIPAGVFLSGPVTLFSSINLRVDTNAILRMLPFGTYPGGTSNVLNFIACNTVHDLEISGQGTLDGQGAPWWTYYNTNNTLNRPMILNLYTCNRLFIHDVTYMNPPNHHCGLRDFGGNILISNLTVNTTGNSPNTDGLNFVATNSIIENCHISDGDDNIAMGSTGPIYDLLITNCTFGTGHGVSFGSGISGVTNVTVINCSFTATGNGLRIKCARDNSLPMKNLNYLNLAMTNVGIPIVFYSYYDVIGTPDRIATTEVLAASNSLPVNATTPNWSNLTISNLTATATDIGGIIWGPTEWPVTNVTLNHVTITAPKTFDLYNVRGVKVIDSTFNFSSGTTFTLCNADLTVSNSTTGGKPVSIGGAASANSLALYNVNAFMTSADAFTCSPLTLNTCVLTNTGNLTFSTNQVINFALGTKQVRDCESRRRPEPERHAQRHRCRRFHQRRLHAVHIHRDTERLCHYRQLARRLCGGPGYRHRRTGQAGHLTRWHARHPHHKYPPIFRLSFRLRHSHHVHRHASCPHRPMGNSSLSWTAWSPWAPARSMPGRPVSRPGRTNWPLGRIPSRQFTRGMARTVPALPVRSRNRCSQPRRRPAPYSVITSPPAPSIHPRQLRQWPLPPVMRKSCRPSLGTPRPPSRRGTCCSASAARAAASLKFRPFLAPSRSSCMARAIPSSWR